MKALVINSSPNMDKGNTHLICTTFIEGMEEAGAEVELVFTKKMSLKPCTGEYHCMFREPGICRIRDDMQGLYPKLAGADTWVFASPVYSSAPTSTMKNVFDRLCPLAEPFFHIYGDVSGYSWRDSTMVKRIVLVSTCGFPEAENFDGIVAQMKTFCRHIGKSGTQTEFAGALLRPFANVFRAMHDSGADFSDIFDAAREAGKQLIREGFIPEGLMEIVSRNLTVQTKLEIAAMVNQFIEKRIAANN